MTMEDTFCNQERCVCGWCGRPDLEYDPVTQMTPEEKEAHRAITCLYVQVPDVIVDDVKFKIERAFEAIRAQAVAEAQLQIDRLNTVLKVVESELVRLRVLEQRLNECAGGRLDMCSVTGRGD